MNADPTSASLSRFGHHHRHHEHPYGFELEGCQTKAHLRRKVFRKRAKSSVSGGGGGDYPYDSDSQSSEPSFPVFDYSRNKRPQDDDCVALILEAAEMLKKEECSSHDEVETVVGDEDDNSSGDETIHSTSVPSSTFDKAGCEAEILEHRAPEEEEEEEHGEQPHAPPLSPASSFSSASSSSSSLDSRSLRSEFIAGLVDFADELISSIWQKPSSDCKTADSVIPMRQFIQEVLRRSQSSYGTLSLALYYLGRASRRPLPQHLRKAESEFPWCKCSRRMFLAALILATKFLHDRAYTNRAWAKLAGLSTREVGLCERALLDWLNWELYVHPRVFVKWQSDIFKRVRGNMSYLSSAEGSALLGMMDANSEAVDNDSVCLQMMQVSIEERAPQPVPAKVSTATQVYVHKLLELQQQRKRVLDPSATDQIDAQMRSIMLLMQSNYPRASVAKRSLDLSCAQESTQMKMVQYKRSRMV